MYSSPDKKFKNWTFIIYTENVSREIMLEILTEYHIPICISPLHTPTNKKPHYHIIIQYPSPITKTYLISLLYELNVPLPQPCLSILGMWRYLQHMDSPEKQQFEGDQRTYISGFKIPEDDDDKLNNCVEFVKYCNNHKIICIRQIFLIESVPTRIKKFVLSNTYLAAQLLR